MIRPIATKSEPLPLAGCRGCHSPRPMGALPQVDWTDWKLWALAAAGALLIWLLLSNTPAKQARSVKIREARARFKGQLARIREEYR
jgi:hypothetical protein